MSIQDDFFNLEDKLEGTPELDALERLWDWACDSESEVDKLRVEVHNLRIANSVCVDIEKTFQTDTVREFMKQAGQSIPRVPTEPTEDERLLRARLILEEALETITRGLGIQVSHDSQILEKSSDFFLDIENDFDMIETIDGAEDLRWVGVDGIYVMCGVDPVAPREEVNRSNMSKFIDGHRREDGKWVKGPSYSPVDLTDKIKQIV